MFEPRLQEQEVHMTGVAMNDYKTQRMLRYAIMQHLYGEAEYNLETAAGGAAYRIGFSGKLSYIVTFPGYRSQFLNERLEPLIIPDDVLVTPMHVLAYADPDRAQAEWLRLRALLEPKLEVL